MSTFVSVGNATQPFLRLLEGVDAIAQMLPQPVFIQAGSAKFVSDRCEVVAFLPMREFEQHVADAELLILHAGAGSVIHAVRVGKLPVIMPRRAARGEHVDDHQMELARELRRTHRVVVADGPADLLDACNAALMRQQRSALASDSPRMLGMISKLLAGYASP